MIADGGMEDQIGERDQRCVGGLHGLRESVRRQGRASGGISRVSICGAISMRAGKAPSTSPSAST